MCVDAPVPSISRAQKGVRRLWRRLGVGSMSGLIALLSALLLTPALAQAGGTPYLNTVPKETLPLASTVPSNGDQNPYGIVTVPRSTGMLHQGDLLVSNFNNDGANGGSQGTGTTIVQIPPGGSMGAASVFTRLSRSAFPGGVGLTTALAVTPSGYVFVGDLPTSDGTSATAKPGGILVLNSKGKLIETIKGFPLLGPWDMTATSHGDFTTLYVSDVMDGTVQHSPNVVNGGNVVRMLFRTVPGVRPKLLNEQVIGRGFPERTDPAALVVGPTGVALGANGILYVADTDGNRIAAIPDAATRNSPVLGGGTTISAGGELNAPLGLTLAPNGDLLAANGGNGNIVEITPSGDQVATVTADDASVPGGGGVLFGLTVSPFNDHLYFVDDGMNTLGVFTPR
jgi:hypothetical protein